MYTRRINKKSTCVLHAHAVPTQDKSMNTICFCMNEWAAVQDCTVLRSVHGHHICAAGGFALLLLGVLQAQNASADLAK
jgi:hypothetical protein